jgi:hypothetical protein
MDKYLAKVHFSKTAYPNKELCCTKQPIFPFRQDSLSQILNNFQLKLRFHAKAAAAENSCQMYWINFWQGCFHSTDI